LYREYSGQKKERVISVVTKERSFRYRIGVGKNNIKNLTGTPFIIAISGGVW
jgi:hypothetical protein